MNGLFISQNELAERWKISETTLERFKLQVPPAAILGLMTLAGSSQP